jgi:regulation of enolase protein 1 (concanavalin A-like superfamily)
MMRQTLDAGSAHAMMLVSVGNGFRFQRRPVTGGTSVDTSGGIGTAPQWVKLTRVGQIITASVSPDGTTWRTVGNDTLSMVGAVHVGLAVSSHTDGALATGTFDSIRVTER